jgi:hypothetical protein
LARCASPCPNEIFSPASSSGEINTSSGYKPAAAATSEILTVISRSPANVQPVLDTIVRAAVKLCNSHDAVVLLRDSDRLRIAAHHGPIKIDFSQVPSIATGFPAAASSIGCRSTSTISQPRVRSFPWVEIFRCG